VRKKEDQRGNEYEEKAGDDKRGLRVYAWEGQPAVSLFVEGGEGKHSPK